MPLPASSDPSRSSDATDSAPPPPVLYPEGSTELPNGPDHPLIGREFHARADALGVSFEAGLRVTTLAGLGSQPPVAARTNPEAMVFMDTVRDISCQLLAEPGSSVSLSRAAARIDHLGRRLHGLGWVRDHEIGGCLNAAVRELSQAPGDTDPHRVDSVQRAILHLGAALAHSREGTLPPGAETAAPAVAADARGGSSFDEARR